MSTMTLKPGLLVVLSTRMEGGVQYSRVDLEASKEAGDDAAVMRWETTKVVEDPAEHERASKARSKCGSLVRSVCTHTAFGLLCRQSREAELDEAIRQAHEVAEVFNASAKTVRIAVFALKGRIAETDDQAALAVSSEMRSLLDEMQAGIGEANVSRIRDAAMRAKKMSAMLDEQTGSKVTKAVEEARNIAKDIMKKLAEGGAAAETVTDMVQKAKLEAIANARYAFLDFEEASVVEPLPATSGRALDTEDDAVYETSSASGGRALEL